MTVTWNTINGESDPVSGEPEEFQILELCFRTMTDDVDQLATEFSSIAEGTNESFQGKAATALSSKLTEIDRAVKDVPRISGELELTFKRHATELTELRRKAGEALGRAQANWTEADAAATNKESAEKRLSIVDTQLESLSGGGDLAYEADRDYWLDERQEAAGWVASASQRHNDAQADLEVCRTEWTSLRDQEDDLDRRTAEAIRSTPLWSLADPSFLEQLGGALADFLEFVAELGEYVFSVEFLKDLYVILDLMTAILDTLSLIATILALIPALTPFMGPAAAILRGAALMAGTLKLIVSIGLAAAGEHEWSQVLGDSFDPLLSVGLKPASKVMGKVPGLSKPAEFLGNNHEVVGDRIGDGKTVLDIATGELGGKAEAYVDAAVSDDRPKRDEAFDAFGDISDNFDFDPPDIPFLEFANPVSKGSGTSTALIDLGPTAAVAD